MDTFFSAGETAEIAGRLGNIEIRNVVFCSFENRFARSGGLAPVITNILPYIKEVNGIPSVILMTPFYPKIMSSGRLEPAGKSFGVPFFNKIVQVELFEYTWHYSKPRKGSLREYYLKAEGFFEAGGKLKDPYIYSESDPRANKHAMDENAVFFCRAVPYALKALGIREDIILHLHEWQTALISLTSKQAMLNGVVHSCGTVQTMHNSYDSQISWDLLTACTNRTLRRPVTRFPARGLTAYQIGLQLVDAPVTTVSEHFAEEFTSDILQTRHFAPHLQNIFRRSGVYGINNGVFCDLSPEFSGITSGMKKDVTAEIRKIKLKNRKKLLRLLSSYRPAERFGELTYRGGSIYRLPDDIPVVLMSGRLAPLQKGYDILLQAMERFPEDRIKVILTPMPASRSDLDYFYEVACKCRGNLTVFPVKMKKGYHELQTGSTFGIMPSVYEPFGAAVEYMANGTVNIARATGGLMDQVDETCGFLYREDAAFYTLENIRDFAATGDIVQMRKKNPWARSMADSLYRALKKAAHEYRHNPDKYYKMILNGLMKVNSFNWEASVRKYYLVYEKVRS